MKKQRYTDDQRDSLLHQYEIQLKSATENEESKRTLQQQFYALEQSAEQLIDRRYNQHNYFIVALTALLAGIASAVTSDKVTYASIVIAIVACVFGLSVAIVWLLLYCKITKSVGTKLLLIEVLEKKAFDFPLFEAELDWAPIAVDKKFEAKGSETEDGEKSDDESNEEERETRYKGAKLSMEEKSKRDNDFQAMSGPEGLLPLGFIILFILFAVALSFVSCKCPEWLGLKARESIVSVKSVNEGEINERYTSLISATSDLHQARVDYLNAERDQAANFEKLKSINSTTTNNDTGSIKPSVLNDDNEKLKDAEENLKACLLKYNSARIKMLAIPIMSSTDNSK